MTELLDEIAELIMSILFLALLILTPVAETLGWFLILPLLACGWQFYRFLTGNPSWIISSCTLKTLRLMT